MNIQKANLNFNMSKIAYGNNPTSIVLHHAEASSCSVQDVHSWHRNQGWAGIGYHYFVRKNGEIFKGREDNWIGSHCLGHNQNTLGICFEGAFNKETMGQTQINAGKELVSYLKSKYGISKVYRHKDLNSTDCPGANFPFLEIAKGSNSSKPVNINKANTNVDNWISSLQDECNRQGFSRQVVDGIPGPNTLAGCPLIRYGARGKITMLLQERLIFLGYSCGPCSADGEFGNATRTAVIKFQKNNGLEADGIVGKNTWRKLLGLA